MTVTERAANISHKYFDINTPIKYFKIAKPDPNQCNVTIF